MPTVHTGRPGRGDSRRWLCGKAADEKGVVAEFLQHAPTRVLERLQLLFNTVLADGVAPTSWRKTIFTMLANTVRAQLVAAFRLSDPSQTSVCSTFFLFI